MPTPPVLFMTAQGEVLAEISNYASTEQILEAMLAVLEAHPEYGQPDEAEQEVQDPIERANILIDLCRDDEAGQILAQVADDDQAVYLRARLARFAEQWQEQETLLGQISDPELADDLLVEQAHRFWAQDEMNEMEQLLSEIEASSNRYTEARYYLGLAYFHQDQRDEAITTWQAIVGDCTQDPWVYRADWALSDNQVTGQSGLGRIGYMGRRNPDLRERTDAQ